MPWKLKGIRAYRPVRRSKTFVSTENRTPWGKIPIQNFPCTAPAAETQEQRRPRCQH